VAVMAARGMEGESPELALLYQILWISFCLAFPWIAGHVTRSRVMGQSIPHVRRRMYRNRTTSIISELSSAHQGPVI
jgi:hypothetical protein